MIKKTVTYTDYSGVERTETYRFNLTKAELMSMDIGNGGGLAEHLLAMVNAKDIASLITLFEGLIKKSYGVMSADGRNFVKNEEVLNDFMQTQAYSDLFMSLVSHPTEAQEFIKGVMPADLAEGINPNTIPAGGPVVANQ